MTSPNDPNGEDSRPTEHFDAQPGYTDDPSQAYGDVGYQPPQPPPLYPQQGYPQQGYNPTQAFPTYGPQNYELPNYDQQTWQNMAPPPEPGQSNQPNGWLIGLGIAALIAVLGIAALVAVNVRSDESVVAAPATTVPRTSDPTLPRFIPGPDASADPFPSELGIPDDLNGLAFLFGLVQSNDGSTLVIQDLTGGPVTVRTTDTTELTAVGVTSVADIPTGTSVVVQGQTGSDGVVTAESIIVF